MGNDAQHVVEEDAEVVDAAAHAQAIGPGAVAQAATSQDVADGRGAGDRRAGRT
jgi:hypothetical protein